MVSVLWAVMEETMLIKNFDKDDLKNHLLWKILDGKYQDQITIVRPTAAGPEPFSGYSAYRLANGATVIGFHNTLKAVSSQGFVAIGDGFQEYISSQPYERVEHLLNIKVPNTDLGTFVFVDSRPVPASLEWRCDTSYYGPMPFPDINGRIVHPTADQSVLIDFQPIISLPGICYLIYLHRKNYASERHHFLNDAVTPMTAATLGECFKLIYEWSQVSLAPFNNTEDIALKAHKFCSILGVTDTLVACYPNMQIGRFLQHHPNARVRPHDVIDTQEDLLKFVSRKMSHLSLSVAMAVNGQHDEMLEVAQLESTGLENAKARLFAQLSNTAVRDDNLITDAAYRTLEYVLFPWFTALEKAHSSACQIVA